MAVAVRELGVSLGCDATSCRIADDLSHTNGTYRAQLTLIQAPSHFPKPKPKPNRATSLFAVWKERSEKSSEHGRGYVPILHPSY